MPLSCRGLRMKETVLCGTASDAGAHAAFGLVSGELAVVRLSEIDSTATRYKDVAATHKLASASRVLTFLLNQGSEGAMVAATDGEIHVLCAERPEAVLKYQLPHRDDGDDPPRSGTALLACADSVFLSGDDAGGLTVFDTRVPRGSVSRTLQQADFISALAPVSRFGTDAILAASGDGSLCAYDLRLLPAPTVALQYATDSFHDDLLSLAVLPHAPLTVAGSLSGALNLYDLRFLDAAAEESVASAAAHVDRLRGHPECVNAVCTTPQHSLVVTASSDGVVRVVDVVAKDMLGILQYEQQVELEPRARKNVTPRKKRKKTVEAWPIEAMFALPAFSHPEYALLCHDEYVRFCDGSVLVDDSSEDEDVDAVRECEQSATNGDGPTTGNVEASAASGDSDGDGRASRAKRKKKHRSISDSAGFFDDL